MANFERKYKDLIKYGVDDSLQVSKDDLDQLEIDRSSAWIVVFTNGFDSTVVDFDDSHRDPKLKLMRELDLDTLWRRDERDFLKAEYEAIIRANLSDNW